MRLSFDHIFGRTHVDTGRHGSIAEWTRVIHRCEKCGASWEAPRDRSHVCHPGSHAGIAAGLDAYHARNLLEALKLIPHTGDWNGSLQAACHIVLEYEGEKWPTPNQTAEQMAPQVIKLAQELIQES